ncbi:uncharacterized protein LOC126833012 [Adelges cooleyi]|uniref:uncharacterized protein LOC126833012 n=1 Tax=Adelges cooleyi TaxID=133065 RepID=UPI002180231C|nr:uncharacterized protein LOC126833012 [Adelges cooleyi]
MEIEWNNGVLKVNGKTIEGFDDIRGNGRVELGSNTFMDYTNYGDDENDEDEIHTEMSEEFKILDQNINADFSGCSLKINGKIVSRKEGKNVHFINDELVLKGKTVKYEDQDTRSRFYNIWRRLWSKLQL